MEYTQEEKKAIENLKEEVEYYKEKYFISKDDKEYNDKIFYSIRISVKDSETLLNLLEKQQKEIERLEKTIDENIVIEPDETGCHEELNIHIKDFIPKEVIRNKIKELENQKISIKVGFEKIFETKMNNAKIIDTLRELLRGE